MTGSIAKRPNGRWRARYRDERGRERSRHFARRIDAQRWLDEVTATVRDGTWVEPRAGNITFEASTPNGHLANSGSHQHEPTPISRSAR